MAILDQLRQMRNFTANEVALADYVLGHVDEVARMNIGELSQASFTSNAAIVRLCRKLGLDGYRDFRVALASEAERARGVSIEVNPDYPFVEGQSTRDIISSVARLSEQAIKASYASISSADVRKAARLILGARHVALYALGDSCATAEAFALLMLKIGVVCFVGEQHGDSTAVSHILGPQDVAVIITYGGGYLDYESAAMEVLRSQGCKTIVITADRSVPDRMAGIDCTIFLPEGESRSERVVTYFSQTCIRFVLNCIYAEAFASNYRGNIERRDRINETEVYE